MQIDFHHAVTYVCARFAGFDEATAGVIAHSAQYVDDATAEGEIWFENGMIFPRMASAHKMLDYKNTNELKNHRVWLPFHFLPGNNQEAAVRPIPAYGSDEFMRRCVCRPNSPPAKEMMQAVIKRQDRPYALYRLGIALHVFMDTWAHQGFVGYQHQINVASDIDAEDAHHERAFAERFFDFWKKDWDATKGDFVGATLPLGHGSVLSYPDRPYLKWAYTNGLGERVTRDNPTDFLEAAKQAYQFLCRYREYVTLGDNVFGKVYGYPDAFDAVAKAIREIRNEDGSVRHQRWIELIASDDLGFKDTIAYIDKGDGSWKAAALGVEEDLAHMADREPLPFSGAFLTSHWKLFHDALQAHRFYVLHELLPRYGLLSG